MPSKFSPYTISAVLWEYIAFTEPDPDGNSYQPAPTAQVFADVRLWLGPY